MQLDFELPADVLDRLAPVVASLNIEVRQAVRQVTRQQVDAMGGRVLRDNGGGSGYANGMRAIVRDVFRDDPVPPPAPAPSYNNDDDDDDDDPCGCGECTLTSCEGDCERCEDYECEQCHNTENCCGWCDTCDTCHRIDDPDYVHVSSRGNEQFCTSCTHFCND